ncbi:XRE family transcriptional regulator [Campylobacter jejuni]|uniref:acyl carrier protein n=1 Tax=Campylobacter TaxID=194 RepID=UPI000874BB1D|nr:MULTISPECIES: acyl carrier protein [Campylobacter]EAL1800929.1 XRE family transcriptional regulator [Campylobacter jejuni]ECL9467077.1 XRE family transcriptional regulator [Campylobacter jejuni]EJJ8601644.1 XRE family transcriptional regulator [Campylobacter jejuni]EJP7864471.1 XRE family transcriptional regulator [Campylobacter jejuni]EKJ1373970.1 XRE family transcriptional regulator [Campylobacter jejuni]
MLSKDEFKKLMINANLSKKELAEKLEVSYNAINGWGTNGRDYPYWVKSWLENYIKAQKYNKIKDLIKDDL